MRSRNLAVPAFLVCIVVLVGCAAAGAGGGDPALGQVAAPSFTPGSGTFSADQTIEITSATEGAEIRYTTDGSAPGVSSTLYTAPIAVAGHGTTMTIRAIARKSGMSDSDGVDATYTINYSRVSTPQFSPAPGAVDLGTVITFSCATDGVTYHYTTDGTDPTTGSPSGTSHTIVGPVTMKVVAVKAGMADSTMAVGVYTVPQVSAPALSPAGSTVLDGTVVTFSCPTAGVTYHYTTDGSTPDGASPTGTSVTLHASCTVTVIAAKSGMLSGGPVAESYTVRAAAPTFGTAPGIHNTDISVSLGCATSGATIRYTTDGTAPTVSSTVYSAPIPVSGNGTLKTIRAIAVKSGLIDSADSSSTYLILYPAAASWARSTTSGTTSSVFNGVTVDNSGNPIAVGQVYPGSLSFGTATLAEGEDLRPLIVKYDSTGTVQWAKTKSSSISDSEFYGVAADGSGNIYAVGYFEGNMGSASVSFSGSPGVTVAGPSDAGNFLLMKFDSTGSPVWGRSLVSGPANGESVLSSVGTDGAGNVYAAGRIGYSGASPAAFDFGGGVSFTVPSGSYLYRIILVKYNSAGTPQWGTVISEGSSVTPPGCDLSVDPASGNAYVVCHGNRTTWSGAVVAKVNTAGALQWNKTAPCNYSGVACDASGNVYAAGRIGGGAKDFGDGVTAAGTGIGNPLIVKYGSSGAAIWAGTVVSQTGNSMEFCDLAVDAAGYVYATGQAYFGATAVFGGGVTGTISSANTAPLIVKYSGAGTAQWAKSIASGPDSCYALYNIASGGSGVVYLAGNIRTTGTYNFGNATVSGSCNGDNAVLIRYE